MPRATKDERDARDALILQLFLAGRSYRLIGKHVSLSVGMVHRIVSQQMRAAGKRREYIADNAYDVYRERLENLYAKAYARATDDKVKVTDQIKAMELCRRYLESMAKLDDVRAEVAPLPTTPLGGDDDDDEDDDGDELASWRRRHG